MYQFCRPITNRHQHSTELSRIALEETRKDKDQIIAQKDKEIIEQEQKMVEMADEFEEMLKVWTGIDVSRRGPGSEPVRTADSFFSE